MAGLLFSIVFYFVISVSYVCWQNATAFVNGRFPFLLQFVACSPLLTPLLLFPLSYNTIDPFRTLLERSR